MYAYDGATFKKKFRVCAYRVAFHRLEHRSVVKGDRQLDEARRHLQIAVIKRLFDLDHRGDELILGDLFAVIHDQHRLHPRAKLDNPRVLSELELEQVAAPVEKYHGSRPQNDNAPVVHRLRLM